MNTGGLTPEENAEWLAAYRAELAGPEPDEGMVLRLAAEKTAHLWGIRIAPDGEVVLNPERMQPREPDAYVTKIREPQPEPEAGS